MVTLVLEPRGVNADSMADHPTHRRHPSDHRKPGTVLGNFSAATAAVANDAGMIVIESRVIGQHSALVRLWQGLLFSQAWFDARDD